MKFKSGIRQHIAVFYALLLCFPIHIYLQMLVTKSQKTQMKCKRYELYSFFARKFRLHFWFGCVGCGMVNLVLYLKKFSTPILCVKVYGFIDFSLTSSLSLVYFCIALYGSVMWHTLGHIEKNWFFLNFTYLNHFIFFKLLVGYNDLNNFQLKRWSRVVGVQNYLNQFCSVGMKIFTDIWSFCIFQRTCAIQPHQSCIFHRGKTYLNQCQTVAWRAWSWIPNNQIWHLHTKTSKKAWNSR